MRRVLRVFSIVTVFLSLFAASSLTSTANASSGRAFCPFEDFCLYRQPNFTGSQLNLFQCGNFSQPFTGHGSFVNNLSTRVQFLGSDGRPVPPIPVPPSSRDFDFSRVFAIRIC
jgi:hypothetical protein